MCGIAGFVDSHSSADARVEAVTRMCGAMRHRSPDDFGIASHRVVALGMRRLAIFDPANGRQPMQSPDRGLTLVFHGTIYNFRELRKDLQRGGWQFRTQCAHWHIGQQLDTAGDGANGHFPHTSGVGAVLNSMHTELYPK